MDERESLGTYLKKERELRNISLRDVARNTRVREPILQAIEEDRLEQLPPPTIVKGFLQSYAKYVGLDTNEVLLRFQTFLKKDQAAPEVKPPRKTFSIKKSWWIAGGSVLVALFALVFIFFSPYDSRPPQPTIPSSPPKAPAPPPEAKGPGSVPAAKEHPPASKEQTPAVKVQAPVPQEKAPAPQEQAPAAKEKTVAPAAPPASATTQVSEKKALSLELKAVEKTWLRIQSSEKPVTEAILQPGEGLSLQDPQRFEVMVGNAGGLHVIFNGKPLEKFGKSGEVVTLIFSPQGVETRRYEKPKPAE